jgi:hypothetical protein
MKKKIIIKTGPASRATSSRKKISEAVREVIGLNATGKISKPASTKGTKKSS